MHAIQPKQASKSSGYIVANSEVGTWPNSRHFGQVASRSFRKTVFSATSNFPDSNSLIIGQANLLIGTTSAPAFNLSR